MRRPTQRPTLDRLHQHTQTKRTAHPPTLSEPAAGERAARAEDYPIGHFGPEHGLTPAQAWEAQQRLNRANRRRPLRGPDAHAHFALRMAGSISAVTGGRVGNSAFGRQLHGHRGGKAMARWGYVISERLRPWGARRQRRSVRERRSRRILRTHGTDRETA